MQDLKRQIVEKGVKQILEEASVPMHIHLKVMQELKKRLDTHDADRAQFQQTMLEVLRTTQTHRGELEKSKAHSDHLLSLKEGRMGEKGEPGEDGLDGEDGEDGAQPDIDDIVARVRAMIEVPDAKEGAPGKDAEFDKEALFKEFLTLIRENKLIDARHIRGLQGWVKDGTKYTFEELMHGGGSSGSNGSVYYTPTGTVDASNSTFTVTAQPTSVIADGIIYFENAGYTYAALTITMTIAPSEYIRYTL